MHPPDQHDRPPEPSPPTELAVARRRCLLAGISPVRIAELLPPGGRSPRTEVDWRHRFVAAGVHAPETERHLLALARADLAGDVDRTRAAGARFIDEEDADWPWLLRVDSAPPPGLWMSGQHRPSAPAVAIVGSRRPSAAGVRFARDAARAAVEAGCLVVSGGALGIDAVAHAAALDAGGATSVVLGAGLDQAGPATNQPLFDRVRRGGHAMISQWPMGTPPRPWRFPVRNRVIASLGLGVVVIEAGTRSGSLITARHAVDLGREVMVMPGSPHDDRVAGGHRLIREGATLVRHAADVLEAIASCAAIAGAAADRAPAGGRDQLPRGSTVPGPTSGALSPPPDGEPRRPAHRPATERWRPASPSPCPPTAGSR